MARGTVLHRGIVADVATLDPQLASSGQDQTLAYDLFIGLVTIDAHGAIVPGLASAWEVSSNGLSYYYHLRPDLKWSDGSHMGAEDIVASFRRSLNPKTAAPYVNFLYPIRNAQRISASQLDVDKLGVAVVDKDTIKIDLEHVTPYFDQVLALPVAAIVPVQLIEKYGDSWTEPGKIVDSGAFTLESRSPATGLFLRRNKYFVDASAVRVDEVEYAVSEDQSLGAKRVRSGELDIMEDFPDQQLKWFQVNQPEIIHFDSQRGLYYFVINTTVAPLTDVRVRRALSLALDREALTKRILRTGESPAYQVVPPGTSNYPACTRLEDADLRPGERMLKARSLLEAAGFGRKNPLKFTLRYNASENHKQRIRCRCSFHVVSGRCAGRIVEHGVSCPLRRFENGKVSNGARRMGLRDR